MIWLVTVLTSLLVVFAGPAGGEIVPVDVGGQSAIAPQKVQVRLEGYLDAPSDKIKALRQLEVRIGKSDHKFALTNIVVLSANASGLGLIEQVTPTKPNFFLAGDKELLEQILSAPPDEFLRIIGYTSFGSRWILISRVERGAQSSS